MKVSIDNKRPGVTHYVRDLKQSAEWYRDKLGFEIGPHEYQSFVEMYKGGEYIFHLTQAREESVPLQDPIFWFRSLNIEDTYSYLQAQGVEVDPMSWYPDYSAFTFRDLEGNAAAISQNFEIRDRELEELLLVGIKVVCKGESQYVTAIPQIAHRLRLRLHEISNTIAPHHMIGAFKSADSNPEEEGYWICVRVEQFGDIPDGMCALTVPRQRYAVKWHYGNRSEVSRTYGKMHNLIQEAEYQLKPKSWQVEIAKKWGEPEEHEIEMDLYTAII